jgi:hypothetical protein
LPSKPFGDWEGAEEKQITTVADKLKADEARVLAQAPVAQVVELPKPVEPVSEVVPEPEQHASSDHLLPA